MGPSDLPVAAALEHDRHDHVASEIHRRPPSSVSTMLRHICPLSGELPELFNLSIITVFWAFGVNTRARLENERELVRRAAELERQREENARRAIFEERVRIARELHDVVVADHVSVMGIQAGAARHVLTTQPVHAQEALTAIETASRHAVAELHNMLGVLRQEGDADELSPHPRLGESTI